MSNAPLDWQELQGWRGPSQWVLSVEQHRQVDRAAIERYHMDSLVLMENAARGCADWLEQRVPPRRDGRQRKMVILCGKGNNGGDGLAIARHAESFGWSCTVFVAGELGELSPDARANADILLCDPQALGKAIFFGSDAMVSHMHDCLAKADVVIDAMLGTGAQGDPKPPFAEWIEAANAVGGMRVAIDMPTGLDAATGQPSVIRFRPAATLTFVALKPAMGLPEAGEHFGEVKVLPIGIPLALLCEIKSFSRSLLN